MNKRILALASAALTLFSATIFAGETHLASGAKVAVDSKFASYSDFVVTDNVYPDDGSIPWSKSWASQDNSKEHFVELTLAKAETVSSIEIFWDRDKGTYQTSAEYTLSYWDGAKWVEVAKVTGAKAEASSKHAASFTSDKIRWYSPAKGGPSARKGIAWITEIVIK